MPDSNYQWRGVGVPTDWDFWQQTFPQIDPSMWEGHGIGTDYQVNPWEPRDAFGGAPRGLVRAAHRELGFSEPYGGGRGMAFEEQVGQEAINAQIEAMAPMLAGALGGYDPQYGAYPLEGDFNRRLAEETGYSGSFGGGAYQEHLSAQPWDIQNRALQMTEEEIPWRTPIAAQGLVANQQPPTSVPGQQQQPPMAAPSPQWNLWAGAFGSDPAMWEGYGVPTDHTVNPWDRVEQFDTTQGILRAALENLGFNMPYGYGRGNAFIENVGEEAVQGAIGQLTGEQPPVSPVVPGGQITAYQPNYSMFFNPQQMAGAVMGGIQPSYETPLWYRAQDVEYSPNPGQPQAASVVPPPAQPQSQSQPPVGIWDPRFRP